MLRVGIVGAAGYTGRELIRWLSRHPRARIELVTSESQAGKAVGEVFPEFEFLREMVFAKPDIETINHMDMVFLAVPHGAAQEWAPKIRIPIIDLSTDHRLSHPYGLPEIYGDQLRGKPLIANPGCYATCSILSAWPLRERIQYAVFDAISGYSGGGQNHGYDYDENLIAYKLTDHRHIPEMEQQLGIPFSFTPHVANLFRGMMVTAHLMLKEPMSVDRIRAIYDQAYLGALTRVVDHIPTAKEVANTPFCLIGGFTIDKNGVLCVVSALDNLLKGAVTQAIENMNRQQGFLPTDGLID